MKKTNDNKKGFTIIEVVLVLAIAGMIFLVVFLAVPQLQQSRRDTQRRSDVARVMSQLETYASNNNGDYPDCSEFDDFRTRYLVDAGGNYNAPTTGTIYGFDCSTSNATVPEVDSETLHYAPASACDGESVVGANARNAAIRGELEGGGFFCIDNQ